MTAIETLIRDIGLAVRRLVRTPGFAVIAVTSLALGVGVNTLMFSFMNAVLLQPLPYPNAERLVMIQFLPHRTIREWAALLPPPMFFLLRDHSQSFEFVGVYDGGRSVNLTDDTSGSAAERLAGHRISATALRALGVTPLIGRLHRPEEEPEQRRAHVSCLSHALWQRRVCRACRYSGPVPRSSTARAPRSSASWPSSFELFDGSADAWMPFGFAPSAAQASQRWLRGRRPGLKGGWCH